MSSDAKALFVLLFVAFLSAFILGIIYKLTINKVHAQELRQKNLALLAVIPESGLKLVDKGKIVLFEKGNKVKYYAAIGAAPGYNSVLQIVVGFTLQKKITAIHILSELETPGLGANSEKPVFYNQYAGKDPQKIYVVKRNAKGNEINAITGATITSRAVTKSVRRACKILNKEIGNSGEAK